jgi:hypothetical protein
MQYFNQKLKYQKNTIYIRSYYLPGRGRLGRSLASTLFLRLAAAHIPVCRGIGTVVAPPQLVRNPVAAYGFVAYLALAGRSLLDGGAHEEERHQGQAYHGQLQLSVAHFRSLNGWMEKGEGGLASLKWLAMHACY